ncbi:MAG: hypothetical protein KF683_21475 [Rubrivivax sp.]|nr:hypothetical protein [Rubrivivax sp.]
MSLLLSRLEAQLAEAAHVEERAVIAARMAGYLARVGRFDEASSLVAALREQFADGQCARASAWLMWAEGVLHYYSDLSPRALDRVARSQLLALALRDSDLAALSSAWKAHIEFETSRFSAMAGSLKLALIHVSPANYSALTRLCMVVADALFLTGDNANAQRWFMRGRDSALSEGDQASIEALVYNRAAFRLAWLRAQRCLRDVSREETAALRHEVESAKNLQELTQVRALSEMVKLCDARATILDGKYEEAVAKLSAVQGLAGSFAGYNFSEAFLTLEIAYCQSRLGAVEAAKSISNEVQGDTFGELDTDERLVAAWMRKEMATMNECLGSLQIADEQLAIASRAYSAWVASIEESINDVRGLEPTRSLPS